MKKNIRKKRIGSIRYRIGMYLGVQRLSALSGKNKAIATLRQAVEAGITFDLAEGL